MSNRSVRRYQIEKRYPLPKSKVWELLSQTDHLNRMIGLFAIEAGPADVQSGLYRPIWSKFFGLVKISWKEAPFEWEREAWYSVRREYESGPIQLFEGAVELIDLSDRNGPGTLVRLYAEFTPTGLLGRLAIPLVGTRSMKHTLIFLTRYLERSESDFQRLTPGFDPLPVRKSSSSVDMNKLEQLFADFPSGKVSDTALEALRFHLTERADHEVADMRPYALAASWGIKREEAFKLFLYAAQTGILNFRWQLICPNCRVPKASADHLGGLHPRFHCDLCGVDYEAGFDQFIELRFSVHPQIRQAQSAVYCIGGPAITPHVYAQKRIEPGQSAEIRCTDIHEQMRLRVLRHNDTMALSQRLPIGDEQPDSDEVDDSPLSGSEYALFTESGWHDKEYIYNGPDIALVCRNESSGTIVVVLERCASDEFAMTAASVTASSEFRRNFASEVLAPGTQVGVENVAFLFSDLLGSTRYYEEVGDASAYGQVRRHFEFLQDWIESSRGALVKTIGDAVMAVFATPEQAVQAAMDIQARLHEFNEGRTKDPIIIKLGVHFGAAIAVNASGVLDYFGRTVNIAARVQSLSVGGDVVISGECMERAAVRALLERYGAKAESFSAPLKGIGGNYPVWRLTVPVQRTIKDGQVYGE